jgi:hypothetical protein
MKAPSTDRLRWILKRLAMGLPVAGIALIGGCALEHGRTDGTDAAVIGRDGAVDAFLADAFVPRDAPLDAQPDSPFIGPFCTSCGTMPFDITAEELATYGAPPDCSQACYAHVGGSSVSCGTTGGFGMVTGCAWDEDRDGGPDGDPGDAGVDGGSPIVARVLCDVEVCHPLGRRPAGHVGRTTRTARVGAWLADTAGLEAASVPAFVDLARELCVHGAPRSLVDGALRAARDEVGHARMVASLARRHGHRARGFARRPTETRSLSAILTDNAAEGCVRESFGALAAAVQGASAADARTRAVFTRIARDEARHALFSFALHDWASAQSTARDQREARDAAAQASAELDLTSSLDDRSARTELGLPDEDRAATLRTLLAV